MTVKYFKLQIEGTNLDKLNVLKDWFETNLETTDLNNSVPHSISLDTESPLVNSGVLNISLYIKSNKSIVKYVDLVKNKFLSFDKTGLTNVSVLRFDSCNHDSENPTPCNPTEVYEWH